MKKVVKLTEDQFISLVKKVIRESVEVEEAAVGQDPSWLTYAKKQYMSVVGGQLRTVKPGSKVVAGNTSVATSMDVSFAFIIPKGTTFTPSPSGNFLLALAYKVDKSNLDPKKMMTDPVYVANELKSGRLKATKAYIAGTDSGTILYENGDSPVGLRGASEPLAKLILGAFA